MTAIFLHIVADPDHIAQMADRRTADGTPVLHREAIADMADLIADMDPRPVPGIGTILPPLSGTETALKIAFESVDDAAAFNHVAQFWRGGNQDVAAWLASGGCWTAPEIPALFTATAIRIAA